MEQFEQLLTCCVCLDRYRNPKLLPCQHSFCMEPCMDGLVDYVRRQVKCPECRAEHRIPYQGVQGFPTNVTLQRFLELHIEITGELPDPTSGQIMERCNVCSEKSYCSLCAHCEKKICEDCKGAHMDILRREISRINNQIRRGIHRLQDALAIVEKNTTSLQTNCLSVLEEVDEIYRRLQKALKDRTEHLRGEVDRYMTTEMKNLSTLKDNLEMEIGNIQSNCDLADKYMTDAVEWDDCELMDTKEIFMKTVEFMRNFEYENSDYNRRVRFQMAIDPNQLVMTMANHGDLNIAQHTTGASPSQSGLLAPPGGPGLMRSKSDHRLATQFRQQEIQSFGVNTEDEPLLGGRRFGERPVKVASSTADVRHSRGSEYDYDYENEPASRTGKARFRSRFVKSHHADTESDTESTKVSATKEKEKDKVISTEDTSKGPLSGIFRIADSPRVMKRLQEQEMGKKEKKEVAPPPKPVQVTKRPVAPVAARQLSEDDEIARIKRQNKGATSTTPVTPPVVQVVEHSERPASERVSALKTRNAGSDDSDHSTPSSPVRRTPPEATSGPEESDASISQSRQQSTRSTTPATVKKSSRSASTDSNTSTESSSASSTAARSSTARAQEEKPKVTPRTSIDTPKTPPTPTEPTPSVRSRASVAAEPSTTPTTPEKKPFQSRFLHSQPPKKEETESSSEEETSSEESEEEEEEESAPPPPSVTPRRSVTAAAISTPAASTRTRDVAPKNDLLARARQDSTDSRKSSRDETTRTGYSSPSYKSSYDRDSEAPKYGASSRDTDTSKYGSSTRDTDVSKYGRTRVTTVEPEEPKYGSSGAGTSSYTSRFLNKSKSTAVVPPPADDDATGDDSDSRYGTGRTRYMAMKERRNRLARSRSTHTFGNDDEDDDPVSPTTASPSAYLASRYGASSSYAAQSGDLSRSRSSHALKSREPSPDRSGGSGSGADKNGAELSSWARYLKNKYGNRGKETTTASTREPVSSTPVQSSSSAAAQAIQRRLSLGLPLRQTNDHTSSDDDSKNGLGSPTSPTVAAVGTGAAGMSPRTQYLQKRRQLFQVGGRGSEPGSFTWPRGIAVGPDNSIVVADSSNHRVQVFDSNGIFAKEFGQYGNSNGEFDCLAGVAVNRIGQFIIADRYNHRIQVLDPSGRFLRAFGSQGTADGKFNYPWGITTDALGFIYVCDKENHRIQVFQSDGTFVGKFGSCGHNEGQLEHPHYIAVSNTNRVIVSDSNNHRIQIFDVNGRVLSTFGGEGSEEGQFKFPRGVAVDDQGYICVADSGNNRIQIFHPDGSFLRAFGSWGSGDAEFKGLEGVAIMSNGNILVCDRENHRVQVF